ncbi:MAG: CDP-2,3-bis-(O-geranylgeranyl)-sn-glycerol synthase [Candidatus Aenigmarchaeota archaeon]|nr:CDP-2,3-bis-(O-geranylgeranyl)-sn-glycerol synthase [Candidatus Aenigmarchaeota archaeon]
MLTDIFNIYVLVEAVWLVLPIYAANGLVPLIKGKRPLDLGKSMGDGRRILGPGKTIEGFLAGCFFGMLIAVVEQLAFPYLPWALSEVPLTIIAMSPALGLLLGFGAMAGDSVGSFMKRRLGLKRGRPAPLLDQLDFLIGSLLIASLAITVKLEWFVILIVMTPIIHWTASAIGYVLKVKKEPW